MERAVDRLALAARIGAALAAVSLLLFMASGPLYRMEWLGLRPALSLFRYAGYGGSAALVLCGALALIAWRQKARQTLRLAAAGALLALLAAAPFAYWTGRALSVPRIHDITTDTASPPRFVALAAARAASPNGADHGGGAVATMQREAYPAIVPWTSRLPYGQLFDNAIAVANNEGWRIAAAVPEEGRIEATDTTFWFGFKDDIVIRIRPQGDGSRLDIRSASRVGLSDVGTNAARIGCFLAGLKAADGG